MGLEVSYLVFIRSAFQYNFGQTLTGLSMLELGNQWIWRSPTIPYTTGKQYFIDLGFEHTSIDLNGEDGSLVRDLREPDQFLEWHNKFDVVTNAGTTEHVEPHEKQYEAFSVIHNCVKVNGLMVNINPDVDELDSRGLWWNHCNTYYSTRFYEMLAAECGYEILDNQEILGNRCVVLKKLSDVPFMTDRSKFQSYTSYRSF